MEEIVAKTKKEERRRQLKEARKKQFEDELQKNRARAEAEEQCIPHTRSRIFRGLKILGHVSNQVPCVMRYVHTRRENFIVTCIGKSINTYAVIKIDSAFIEAKVDVFFKHSMRIESLTWVFFEFLVQPTVHVVPKWSFEFRNYLHGWRHLSCLCRIGKCDLCVQKRS